MQYRVVGDTGISVSALGFGTMRFNGPENAAEIIDYGLAKGITYFDIGAAYAYKSFDENAEVWAGNAIADVPREKMVLSAKAQPRYGDPKTDANLNINTRDDMWKCIENSLKRVGVEYFDFYQLWDMSADDHFAAACEGPDSPLQAMREAKEQGLVKQLGFTSHAKPENTVEYLKAIPDFRFVTIYYNFNDRGPEIVLDYCKENSVGVCIMGPLRGGILTGKSETFSSALPEFSDATMQEIALRFLFATPGVSTVISGMNTTDQVDQNAAVAELQAMSLENREAFMQAFVDYTHGEPLCTGCRYCADCCPQGLPVPEAMSLYQLSQVFGLSSMNAQIASLDGSDKWDPVACVDCGICVGKCPQDLPIPDRMSRLSKLSKSM